MSREIRAIPPAPRQTLWSAVAWTRWPLAFCGGLAIFIGGSIATLLVLAAGGRSHDDDLIEVEGIRATARVLEVQENGRRYRGKEWVRYIYAFPEAAERADSNGQSDGGAVQLTGATAEGIAPGTTGESAPRPQAVELQAPQGIFLPGTANPDRALTPLPDYEYSCFAPSGLGQEGDSIEAEFAATEPHLNRLVGGRAYLPFTWAHPNLFLGLLVLPGLLCLGFWMQGANDLRRVLSQGDVSLAEVVAVERVRWVLPLMYRVRYRFRDHHADLRMGKHWVRVRSELGEHLAQVIPPELGLPPELRPADCPSGRMAVIHDRRWPQVNRLVIPVDFALPLREQARLAEELAQIRAD